MHSQKLSCVCRHEGFNKVFWSLVASPLAVVLIVLPMNCLQSRESFGGPLTSYHKMSLAMTSGNKQGTDGWNENPQPPTTTDVSES